jgi:MFS family permease
VAKVIHIITPSQAQIMNIVLITIYAITSVLAGLLADKVDPRKQVLTFLTFSILSAIVIQLLMAKQIFTIYLPMILIGLAPLYIVPLQIIVLSIFTVDIRMRMCSLSHSIGSIIFSGATPFFCMLLWQYSGSLSLVFGFFLILLLVLFCSTMYLCGRTFQ